MEKYPKVQSKVFRGAVAVGEYLMQQFSPKENQHKILDSVVDKSMFRGEPEDQQHVTGVPGGGLPIDPRLRLVDQDEGGHTRGHGFRHD